MGVIGNVLVTKNTATNITNATALAMKDFCTPNFGAPYTDKPDPPCDEDLLTHMLDSVHSLTVDAASNEVVAGENSMDPQSVTAKVSDEGIRTALFQNLKCIVRDKAHASRRVLERPWACDQYCQSIANKLISQSDSVAQVIEHSPDLRQIYGQCVAESATQNVSTVFSNFACCQASLRIFYDADEPYLFGLVRSYRIHGRRCFNFQL